MTLKGLYSVFWTPMDKNPHNLGIIEPKLYVFLKAGFPPGATA